MSHQPPLTRRALLSVSDKTGIVEFARQLSTQGYEIISTGGTKKALEEAKIPVISVEEITKFPECFGGRVKTMHPMIMGGVLFRRDVAGDKEQAKKLDVKPIDLVVVNLYPFEETLKNLHTPGSTLTDADIIEQIDIGGPTLLRSAAKNHDAVTVVCDPLDYEIVAQQLHERGDTTLELRAELAAKVFVKTAQYDATIAGYLGMNRGIILTEGKKLRYGENPHQWGEFYSLGGDKQEGKNTWQLLQGKEMSYLNFLDSDGAWRIVSDFSEPTSVMVKHANPSGVASALTIENAFQRAYDADRLSAFGVIIAINRECSEDIAKKIIDQKMFVEVILAPSFSESCLALLAKKPNIRLLAMGTTRFNVDVLYRSAFGGVLAQNDDLKEITETSLACVTKEKPTPEQIKDLLFAWKVVKHAKSNAIVLAKDECTVGIGAGQTSRVDSTWIAAKRAGERAKGAVMASDAFFPFPDSIEEAVKHGITAIIQPGGSVKDNEVFAKADELGIAMVVTGVRAFRH